MTESALYNGVFWGWLGMSAVVFCLLFFVSAPYGRMARQGWGPQIPTRMAWLVMELPAVMTILAQFYHQHPRPPPFLISKRCHFRLNCRELLIPLVR